MFDHIYLNKKGNNVTIQFGRFKREIITEETSTTVEIGTIPEAYRPAFTFSRVTLATLAGIPMYVSINTSGKLSVRVTKTIATNTNSYAEVLYTA